MGFVIVLVLALQMILSVATPVFSEVNDDYALKISLETQLEKKLKQVIIEITGTDKVVIFVNAELISKGSERGKIEKKSDALVLPGVPAKKEFGAGQSSELTLPGTGKISVKKLVLSIWIDSSVPGSIVDLIQDIAKNVIGFSQTRGDQINVKKVDFESKGFFGTLFAFPNFLWFILTIVGGFMLVTLGIFFMDPLKKVVPALKDIDWSVIRGAGRNTAAEQPAPQEREAIAVDTAQPVAPALAPEDGFPFSFVRERDIPGLAFLLKDRTPQDAAIVINYLDPALSIRLLDRFPKDKQIEIALVLGKEEINAEKVIALEELVKSKLSYVVGGENKLIMLLDMTNEEVRDKVVKALETRDALAGSSLKQRIKSLESIISELQAPAIQTLYRNINATLFAQVLKSSPETVQQKVVASLSAGAAERFKEEMRLSRELSAARLRSERRNLMVLIRRLISDGLVEVENS